MAKIKFNLSLSTLLLSEMNSYQVFSLRYNILDPINISKRGPMLRKSESGSRSVLLYLNVLSEKYLNPRAKKE